MTGFVLAYDMRGKPDSHDYQPLWDELKRFGSVRVQDSFWLISASNTAKELHDHIKKYMHTNDRLWVSELTKLHFGSNIMPGTNEWLVSHPQDR